MSLVLDHATPVARVEHRCDVCSGVIGRGDRYVRQRNVQDGEAFTWKGHSLCSAAYMKAARDQGCVLAYEEYPDPDSEVMPIVRGVFAALCGAPTSGRGVES